MPAADTSPQRLSLTDAADKLAGVLKELETEGIIVREYGDPYSCLFKLVRRGEPGYIVVTAPE